MKTDSFPRNCGDRISLASSASAQLIAPAELPPMLKSDWIKLAHNAVEPNIFYEYWALQPAIAEFCSNLDMRLFLFWAGQPNCSDLIGLLPIAPTKQFGRWPVPHIQNWMHHNCFLGTPLVRTGFERQFWQALFRKLDTCDWPGFLHINGMTIGGPLDQAMRAVCDTQGRRCDLVHSEARALLESDLGADDYYAATVRGKKRKELRRQAKRLSELGQVTFGHWQDATGLEPWITEFLALERRGWKGKNGSALDCNPATQSFFSKMLKGAADEGRLERHDIRLDDMPLAMLINLHSGSASFSFKTAFDEEYARFSPGVLLQLENLKILDNPGNVWMDSCAAEDHPMIDSLWSERRHIGRFSVELSGVGRKALFRSVRMGEDLMAQLKGREIIDVMQMMK